MEAETPTPQYLRNPNLRIPTDWDQRSPVAIADPIRGKRTLVPSEVASLLVTVADDELESAIDPLLLAALRRHNLLVPVEEVDDEQRKLWDEAGWDLARDYFEATFDYPCLDYATDGRRADRARMEKYLSESAEPDRFYVGSAGSIIRVLPAPSTGQPSEWPTDTFEQKLDLVLALGFAPTGYRRLGSDRDALILRASPSGGGRAPCQGFVLDVQLDQPTRVARIQPDGPPCIVATSIEISPRATVQMFPELYARDQPSAIVVITSQFDRNMFRYREPRTFRTVHMDAGHIIGTLEMAANEIGLETSYTTVSGAVEIERQLALDPLEEAYMCAVALYC